MTIIQDGTGKGYFVKVDDENRLLTRTISDTTIIHESGQGNAWNINTQNIPVSTSGESALLYFKNNGSNDAVISSLFIGIGTAGGSAFDNALVRCYTNPTGGTLVSGGGTVTVVNRRIGSGKSFSYTVLSGSSGFTITGQAATPVLYQTQTASSRVAGDVNLTIPNGQSVAFTIDLKGAQPANVYFGLAGYEKVTSE